MKILKNGSSSGFPQSSCYPGLRIRLPEEEDDFDFAERFATLKAELEGQMKEEERLNRAILENLAKVQLPGQK